MPRMEDERLADLADQLVQARRVRQTITAWSASPRHALSLEEAYTVQDLVLARRLARGERLVGWKLGYTSQAMRDQMGIDEPNAGPLTDVMQLVDDCDIPGAAIQPLAEPEIAVRLAAPPAPGSTVAQVADLVDGAWAALEVCDPIWSARRFRLEDNTADGSSAAWFVLGDPLPPDHLDSVGVRFIRNGAVLDEARGAAAGGHPLAGVSWLAGLLGRVGKRIEPGQMILTGGLTAGVAMVPGDTVAAEFTASGGVVAGVSVSYRGGQARSVR